MTAPTRSPDRGSDRLHPGLNLGATDGETHVAAEQLLFGFWVFLMSDLVLFAVLFATYAGMSVHGVAGGPAPRDVVALGPAFIETLLLLGSSLAIGLCMLELKHGGRTGRVLGWLGLTGLLGAGFVGLEARDFALLAAEGAHPQRSGFLSAFWLLTGTHMIHVSAGLAWMAVLAAQLRMFGLAREVKLRLLRLALFWHMLDVVWIAIFTFVHLYGAIA